MPWYLYIAWKHLFPDGKRFPFFTFMSITGVALGVALLIVVISVFNGFGYEIRTRIADTYGDLRIINRDVIYDVPILEKQLKKIESVASFAPYAHGMVMLQFGNRPLFPIIQGVDLTVDAELEQVKENLMVGDVDDFDDDTIVISSGLAEDLSLRIGDRVDIYTPLLLEKLKKDEIILPREMEVIGIFHTGWQKVDEGTVLSSLRTMQDLYGLGNGIHGVKVTLKKGYDSEAQAIEITTKLGRPYEALTWMESNREFLSILQFEKRMMFFLLFFIIIVSAFSITSSLLISVIRKTREIGLFGSMGATSREISLCFCFQGLGIGLTGTIAGFALGFTLLAFRDQITQAIASLMGIQDSMSQFYAFSYLPVHIEGSDLALIAILSVAVATLAGLIPAYKAGRMAPVEALRSE